MELKDFVVEPCKSRLAFEFVPKHQQNLELKKVSENLQANGVTVDIETPFVLMAQFEKHGVSLFKSGKMIVKNAAQETEARQIAEILIQKMYFKQ